ncbi:MAG: sulfatase-like hydrolase/transferase [Rhodobacteraceae bacterium]|jgi:arylsulfatase A-like enzyme|nr:sulfatase-like hydrolase/transferase [Paracoccaceae bacterium]
MRSLAFLPLTCLAALPTAAFGQGTPNVLLIVADDMGIDASRCYALGEQQAPMPNLEALCASGMVFENAYSAPVCSPTRATIMTGQYGFRTGVGAAIPPDGTSGLSADLTSLFDVLAATDYSANLIGKWHLAGSDAAHTHPAELGVPDYFGPFMGGVRDYWHWTAVSNGEDVPVDGYATTVLTDRAIDWIGGQTDPWFLWLAYNAPHTPFHLPPGDLHGFDDLSDDADAIAQAPLGYYNAMLEALDTEIGRLLASLSPEDRDNTLIIFIGDNGTPSQVVRSLYGPRGAKGTIYDAGTHVPWVVAGPGVVSGRAADFVMTSDLFATIAGVAGVTVQMPDSFDFGPMLAGEPGARTYVYVEHFSDEAPRGPDIYGWAVREGDYKLVQRAGEDAELYHLGRDPFERTDLLADGTSEEEALLRARLEVVHASIRQ